MKVKSVVSIVCAEALVLGYEIVLIRKVTSDKVDDEDYDINVLTDCGSMITSLCALCLSKYITKQGQWRFLKNISLWLSLFFILQLFITPLSADTYTFFSALLLLGQKFCETGFFTVVLSIISVIDREKVGFYIAAQTGIMMIFIIIGGVIAALIKSIVALKFAYCVVVFLFVAIVFYTSYQQDGEEESQEQTHIPWSKILGNKFVRMGCAAFAITMGMTIYSVTLLITLLLKLQGWAIITAILAMIFTFPAALIIIYSCFKSVKTRLCIILGLMLESLSMLLMAIIEWSDDVSGLMGFMCPLFMELGMVLIIVSALPDMLESFNQESSEYNFSQITDRICSLVYPMIFIGNFSVGVALVILFEVFGEGFAFAACALVMFLFALLYEGESRALRTMFNPSSRDNLELYIIHNESAGKNELGISLEKN